MVIRYEDNSFVPHFSTAEMASMKRMLSLDLPSFEFDAEYAGHIKKFNGGKPINKYFRIRSGNIFPIDRFLNYSDTDLLTDKNQKNLNANVVWSLIDDRLGIYLLPFAILPNGDFLCFDYESGVSPTVVLWSHELSNENEPHTEAVANNFAEFVFLLSS